MPPPKDPVKREEWRRKLSEALKGDRNPNYGKPRDPQIRAKISESLKGKPGTNLGRKFTEEHKRKIGLANSRAQRGKKRGPYSEERKRAIAEGLRLYYVSNPEARHIRSESKRGSRNPMYGRPLSTEHRTKIARKLKAYLDRLSPAEKGERIRAALEAPNLSGPVSSIEDRVASVLDSLGVRYQRQKRIGRFRVDFLIPDTSLVIECDGCYWHCCEKCGYRDRSGKRREDSERQRRLEKAGFLVVRIWEHDIRENPILAVKNALELVS